MFKYSLIISALTVFSLGLDAQKSTKSHHTSHSQITEVKSVKQFESLLATHAFVVVDFYAPWCGPCKRMNPIIQEIAQEHTNVLFIKINIDAVPALADRYHVRSVPTFIFFRNGNSVHRTTGTMSKQELRSTITNRF